MLWQCKVFKHFLIKPSSIPISYINEEITCIDTNIVLVTLHGSETTTMFTFCVPTDSDYILVIISIH